MVRIKARFSFTNYVYAEIWSRTKYPKIRCAASFYVFPIADANVSQKWCLYIVLTRVNRIKPASTAVLPEFTILCSFKTLGINTGISASYITELVVNATIFVVVVATETQVAVLQTGVSEKTLCACVNAMNFCSEKVLDMVSKSSVLEIIWYFIVSITTQILWKDNDSNYIK